MLTTIFLVFIGLCLLCIAALALFATIALIHEMLENWQVQTYTILPKVTHFVMILVALFVLAVSGTTIAKMLPEKECCPPVEIKQTGEIK